MHPAHTPDIVCDNCGKARITLVVVELTDYVVMEGLEGDVDTHPTSRSQKVSGILAECYHCKHIVTGPRVAALNRAVGFEDLMIHPVARINHLISEWLRDGRTEKELQDVSVF